MKPVLCNYYVTYHCNANVHRLDEVYKLIAYPNRLILIINPLFEYNTTQAFLNSSCPLPGKFIDAICEGHQTHG